MPLINGVDFNSISSLNGVSLNSVTNIGGVSVSHEITCETLSLGYSDGRKRPPSEACLAAPQDYDFDATNGLLFLGGFCNELFAMPGFYSDGVKLWNWDGNSNFILVGPCGR